LSATERIDRGKSLGTIKQKKGFGLGDIESGDTSVEWRRLGGIRVVNSTMLSIFLYFVSKWWLQF
jgi:hypothetical protein